jgi:hypothetical protein
MRNTGICCSKGTVTCMGDYMTLALATGFPLTTITKSNSNISWIYTVYNSLWPLLHSACSAVTSYPPDYCLKTQLSITATTTTLLLLLFKKTLNSLSTSLSSSQVAIECRSVSHGVKPQLVLMTRYCIFLLTVTVFAHKRLRL